MCNLARSNLATGLYQEGFFRTRRFPLLHERCLGNSSGGARAMLQKNMCHLRMAVGKSTADRSPNFEEYLLHCKNSIHITFQNPATIDCTLTYCVRRLSATIEEKKEDGKKQAMEVPLEFLDFNSRLNASFLVLHRVSKRSLLKSFPPPR